MTPTELRDEVAVRVLIKDLDNSAFSGVTAEGRVRAAFDLAAFFMSERAKRDGVAPPPLPYFDKPLYPVADHPITRALVELCQQVRNCWPALHTHITDAQANARRVLDKYGIEV